MCEEPAKSQSKTMPRIEAASQMATPDSPHISSSISWLHYKFIISSLYLLYEGLAWVAHTHAHLRTLEAAHSTYVRICTVIAGPLGVASYPRASGRERACNRSPCTTLSRKKDGTFTWVASPREREVDARARTRTHAQTHTHTQKYVHIHSHNPNTVILLHIARIVRSCLWTGHSHRSG